MSAPFSYVQENTREEILSSDINRAQRLQSRELQNFIKERGYKADGSVINGISGVVPTITPIPATFTVDMEAGQGFVEDATGLTADDSDFQVLRWLEQLGLTFSAPGGNDRIDLIVATPGTQATDTVSRNILLDPVARTVAAANVEKTVNPQATVAVIEGVPAATPVPPAVPAGTYVLFEVYVPTTAIAAGDFTFAPQLFPLTTQPLTRQHGVLKGCNIRWSDIDAAVSSIPQLSGNTENIAIIDGEMVIFASNSAGATEQQPQTFGDGNAPNNPFAVVNPSATAMRPFYIYLVGGRHAPQITGQSAFGVKTNAAIVCSLVPPFNNGKPSANITTPRGTVTTDGAVYVGMGFTKRASTDSAACIMDTEMVTILSESFNQQSFVGPFAFDPITIPQIPTISRRVKISGVINVDSAGAPLKHILKVFPNVAGLTGAENSYVMIGNLQSLIADAATDTGIDTQVGPTIAPLLLTTPQFLIYQDAALGDQLFFTVHGFSHHAARLDGGIGQIG